MAIYEIIPTILLSEKNELLTPAGNQNLPELVHTEDTAKTVFIDFTKVSPITITPQTPIDKALSEMKTHHQSMILVERNKKIVGLIGSEDILSERPLRLMHRRRLKRSEITVDMLMQPREKILVMEVTHLKNAQVGHIINTLKQHSAHYILVVKQLAKEVHQIMGFFSASQISKQLGLDLSAILRKEPETIIELTRIRKL